MLTEIRSTKHEQSENFLKEIKIPDGNHRVKKYSN